MNQYSKVPSCSLLPVLGFDEIYIVHARHYPTSSAGSSAQDGRIAYVKKYAQYLSEIVVCLVESSEYIERVLSETGKKVVPVVAMESVIPDKNLRNAIQRYYAGKNSGPIDPKQFVPSPEYAKYLEYLSENIDIFPYILVGNYDAELRADYLNKSRVDRNLVDDLPSVMIDIENRFPVFENKIAFFPTTGPLVTYILKHREDLCESPLVQFATSRNTFFLTAFGGHCLRTDHPDPSTPDRILPYPHIYLNDFFSYVPVYGGIGWNDGAARHNLSKFVHELGMEGAFFFVPNTVSDESERLMEDFLTDIER